MDGLTPAEFKELFLAFAYLIASAWIIRMLLKVMR